MVEPFDWANPKYAEIRRRRMERLDQMRRDPLMLAAHWKIYSTDVVRFVEDWGETVDPRNISLDRSPAVPFVLFPRQREFLEWLTERDRKTEVGVVEKSRDMGISWLLAVYAVHSWLFRPGCAIGYGSYEDDRVDKIGVLGSWIEKCRYQIRALPPVLKPEGFIDSQHLLFKRLVNPENGSTIVGEVGDNIGRGDRATLYFIDEAAFLAHQEKVDASLSQTTPCRIYASTAHGQGPFYQKVRGGIYSVFRFHWTQDPRKSQAWYDEQCEILDPVIVAQEIDIDHEASIEDICIPATYVSAGRSEVIRDYVAQSDLTFEKGVAGLDVAGGGTGKNVFVARFGPIVRHSESWSDGNTTRTAHRAVALAKKTRVQRLNYDADGVGTGVASTLSFVEDEVIEEIPLEELGSDDIDRAVNLAAGYRDPAATRARRVQISTCPIHVGVPASKHVRWPDGQTSREKFVSTKAEIWWMMRDRLEKTYETWLELTGREGGRLHPPDELLVLPDDDQLCSQLSLVRARLNSKGKIGIEDKVSLKTRGIASPDFAEALSLTFVPERPRMQTGKLEGFY